MREHQPKFREISMVIRPLDVTQQFYISKDAEVIMYGFIW